MKGYDVATIWPPEFVLLVVLARACVFFVRRQCYPSCRSAVCRSPSVLCSVLSRAEMCLRGRSTIFANYRTLCPRFLVPQDFAGSSRLVPTGMIDCLSLCVYAPSSHLGSLLLLYDPHPPFLVGCDEAFLALSDAVCARTEAH